MTNEKCTAKTTMVCDRRCNHCGFSKQEAERRKRLIEKNGLTEVGNLRKLIIPRPHSTEYYMLLNDMMS